MGQQVKVTGIVLSTTNVGEYDKRVVLLTKERGKIAAFARGARKMNSPLLAACQPFTYGVFTVFEGKNYNINGAEVEDYFKELRTDLQCLYRGFYFCEMADYFTVERNDELLIMQLLYLSLNALRKKVIDQELIQIIYEIKILALFGLMMETGQCICCSIQCKETGTEEPSVLTHFCSEKGGVVCSKCAMHLSHTIPLQESTLYALQFILSQPVTKLFRFQVTKEVLRELKQISADYQRVHVNHKFQSLEFLKLI